MAFNVRLCYILSMTSPRSVIFFLDPILGWADLPMVLCMVFAHDFGHDGFQSMVLDTMVFGPWYWMIPHV